MPDDFCLIHGYEHMRSVMGNPIPYCEACEAEREAAEEILREVSKKMADDAMAVLCGANAFKSPRPTALRLNASGGFEVVEIHDDGSIIEPPKPCPRCGPILLCAEHMALIS